MREEGERKKNERKEAEEKRERLMSLTDGERFHHWMNGLGSILTLFKNRLLGTSAINVNNCTNIFKRIEYFYSNFNFNPRARTMERDQGIISNIVDFTCHQTFAINS